MLASLAIYGVIALAVFGSIFGFIRSHDNGVREDEAGKWKPKLEVLSTKLQEQSAAVEAFKKASDDATARAKDWEAKASVLATKAQTEQKKKLALILAAPPEKDKLKDCRAAEALTDSLFTDRLLSN